MGFFAGTLRTGKILIPSIPAHAGSTVAAIGSAGTISCSIKLPIIDPYTGVEVPFTNLIVPGKSFLGYEEVITDDLGATTSKIINAGPIWTDSYDWDARELKISAAGLRSIFDYRFVLQLLNDLNPSDLPGDTAITYTSSLRTIAKKMVLDAIANTGGELPIDFEADVAGVATRTYTANEYHRVNEKLQQISSVLGGPDIAFRPVRSGTPNYIRWNMVTGNPELKQAGADHAWDSTVPVPAIKGTSTTRDARTLLTAAYGLGGSAVETDPPIEAKSIDHTLTDAGYPRLEDALSSDTITVLSTLQGHLDEAVLAGEKLMETWSFQAKKDGRPAITTFNEGDYARIVVKGNPAIPDGSPRVRIMSYTADLTDAFAKVTCAPERL